LQFEFENNLDWDVWEDEFYIYYGLDGFYQNIRKYVRSRQDEQLGYHDATQENAVLNDIDNMEKCKENWGTDFFGFVYYPCGLTARYVFDDTFFIE